MVNIFKQPARQMQHRRSASGECCAAILLKAIQHIQSKIRECQELLEKSIYKRLTPSSVLTRRTIHQFAVFLWIWCQQISRQPSLTRSAIIHLDTSFTMVSLSRGISSLLQEFLNHGDNLSCRLLSCGRISAFNSTSTYSHRLNSCACL